jgi:hypothetical protein
MTRPTILHRGRQWRVTNGYLETHDGKYVIAKARLAEGAGGEWPWPVHMAGKNWVDLADFIGAWKAAIRIHTVRGKARVTPEQIADAERRACHVSQFERC